MRRWNAVQPAVVTRSLVVVNVLVFMWTGRSAAATFGGGTSQHQIDLALARVFVQQGEWWRVVTSGFLHFGVLHIAMNMMLLWQLGNLLEPALGRTRFALLYFGALCGGAVGALLFAPDALTGGASGAVFGLMGAASVALWHRGVNPMRTPIGTTLILNLLITFTIPGISVGGHLGGVAAGAMLGFVMFDPSVNRSSRWMTYAAPVVMMAACFVAIGAVTA